jgi:MFS family permease
MKLLIAMRAIQGLGAGAMQPITLTIIGDIFTIEERARIQGIFGAVWGFSAMIGPLAGGLIVGALSWRWVFFINVPPGILSAVMLLLFYVESGRSPTASKQLDVLGALALSMALISLLLGVGGRAPLITLPATVAFAIAFVLIEKRAVNPILPLSLLARPVIGIGSIIGGLMGSTMMGVLMYTPLFVQGVLGASPTEGGTSIAPMLIGWPIASAASGRLLPRTGFRPLVRVGLALVGIGALAIYLTLDRGTWPIRIASFVMGTGMGLANTAVIIAVQESVAHGERGVATASTMFSRSIGGAIVTGALGALIAALLRGKVPEHLLDQLLSPDRSSLDPTSIATYSSAIHAAMMPIFAIIVGLGALTTAAGFWFPRLAFGAGVAERARDAAGEATSI